MWTVQLIVISFGMFTLIKDAVGLEDEGEGLEQIGSIGINRAFIYGYGYYHRPRAALWIGRVLKVANSSECCQACRNQFTHRQTGLFNFDRDLGIGSAGGSHLPQCTCLENKSELQPATYEIGTVTGTCDPCFEFDVHHTGNGLNHRTVLYGETGTALNCQRICRIILGCLWFNWDRSQDQCWLMSDKGDTTVPKLGSVSGPKRCPTGNDGGTVKVDGDLGDGKAFSMFMDDLYLGNTGISSRRGVSSRSCCLLCQHSYPQTQMFQYLKDIRFCDCYKTPAGNPVPTHRSEYLAGICGTD